MGKYKKLVVLLGFLVMLILPSKLYSSVSAETSANLTSGTGVTKTLQSDEVHDYKFTTNKDGEVYLTLDKTSGGMRVEIQDAKGDTKATEYIYSGGDATNINIKVLKGTYRVFIEPYRWDGMSSSKYSLKVTYPGKFTRNKTSFEPNDTSETAYSLTNGKITNSTLESKLDVDKYKFTTNKDGEIYITLDGSSAPNQIRLYDEYGTSKAVSYNYYGLGSAFIKLNEVKGTYYVEVRSYGWTAISSAKYRLKASFAAPFTRDAKLESNDTIETAYPITSDKSYTSTSFSELDVDTFKISTRKSSNVTVKLDKSNERYLLEVYDLYQNRKGYEYIYTRGSSATLDMTLDKGTYFIKVTPYDWDGVTSSNYRILAVFQDKIPAVYSVSNRATVIKGSVETGAKVYAYVGKKLIGSTTATSGKYTMKIPKQKVKTVINVYTVDKGGVQSRNKKVTVINKTPKVSAVSNVSTTVKGSAETGAKVYAYVGEKLIGSTTASSGKYTIKIAKQKAKKMISVHIVDKSGVKSASKTVKVSDKIAPIKPTIAKVTNKSNYVSGKTEASATVYIYNGKKYLAKGTANSEGNYKIKIAKQKKGSTIKVHALDAAKNKSKIASREVVLYVPIKPILN